MNEADVAEASEALILEQRVKAIKNRDKPKLVRSRGSCFYCEEPFAQGDTRVFCDADCRDDNLKYKK